MSGFDDFWGDDPDYDGQGKSREEETDGSLRVLGCLLLVVTIAFIAALVGLVIWIA